MEADLLAAEGKYDAAEDLYLKMESSGDNELRNAAAFGRAGLLLRRGKSAAAAAIFQQLADGNSIWHYPARRELAYTMIRMKQYAGALKQLELIPESQRGVSFSLLYLLAKVYSGDMGEFKQYTKPQTSLPTVLLLQRQKASPEWHHPRVLRQS